MAFPRNDLNRDVIFDSVITCTGFALGLQRIRLRLLVHNLAGCWCCRTSCSFNELLDFAAIMMQLTRQQQLAKDTADIDPCTYDSTVGAVACK